MVELRGPMNMMKSMIPMGKKIIFSTKKKLSIVCNYT